MSIRIVERKSVKGTPTWYIYGPTGYLGSLFFPDAEVAGSLEDRLAYGVHSDVCVEFVSGPDFGQVVS